MDVQNNPGITKTTEISTVSEVTNSSVAFLGKHDVSRFITDEPEEREIISKETITDSRDFTPDELKKIMSYAEFRIHESKPYLDKMTPKQRIRRSYIAGALAGSFLPSLASATTFGLRFTAETRQDEMLFTGSAGIFLVLTALLAVVTSRNGVDMTRRKLKDEQETLDIHSEIKMLAEEQA